MDPDHGARSDESPARHSADFNRDFYLKVFEDFPALIWRAGLDMKCDYFNRTWLEFTGRSMDQEYGDGWAEGVHPEDLDRCFRTYVENFQARRPFSMFYRLRNSFGEYRWIKDIGRPFYGFQEEFLGYIGSCYDVTEEREKEVRLTELNAAKDLFFSIIAHDLRGPMGAIEAATADLLQSLESFNQADVREILSALAETATHTNRLLGDLLTWSQAQMQGSVAVPVVFDLGELVGHAIEPLREGWTRKGLRVELSLPAGQRVLADVNMARTIVRNLVSNAIKFSLPGGSIELGSAEHEGSILLHVVDHGVGMSPEDLAGLFILGARPSRQGTVGERGTGLGLSICREFAEKNGGKIWAESNLGRGSIMTLRLPAAGTE
jgi:two-component system CheB/CheR fusion protein